MASSPRRRKGSALIMAVAVAAAMVILAVSAAARLRTEADAQKARLDAIGADRMAEAGLARAMAALQTLDPNAATTTTDDWRELGSDTAEEFKVGDGSFRVQILDAGAFVDLNAATEDQLLELPITQEQVDCLLDWRESGTTARTDGAKDDYYNSLSRPYNTALKKLTTLSELLAIKSFDGPTLYDPPTGERVRALSTGSSDSQKPLCELTGLDALCANIDSGGQQRLNVNQVQAQQMIQRGISANAAQAIVNRRNTRGTFTTMKEVVQTPGVSVSDAGAVLDFLALNGNATLTGRINLNTASEDVLRTIPNISDQTVQAIISRQGSFASLSELADLAGVNSASLADMADMFTVNTSAFRVRVMGIRGSRRSYLEAIVQFVDNEPKLIRREVPPFADMDQRWGWADEATTKTDLTSSS